MKKLITSLSVALACLAGSTAHAQDSLGISGTECPTGNVFSTLIAMIDINQLFPLTIMGATVGSGQNPPLMYAPPVCSCPSIFGGFPSPGVGSTYWQPRRTLEIQRTAGCMEPLGGLNVLGSMFKSLNSEQVSSTGHQASNTSRMQVHDFQTPVFSMLNMFSSMACKDTSGFNVGYMTEPDWFFQSDPWGAQVTPEAVFFSDLVIQASCAVDTIASTVGFPLTAMFWCQGGSGSTYPMTGNSQHNNSPFQMNTSIQNKYIARQSRFGTEFATVGPVAVCYTHPTPIWIKEQYKINQALPVPRKGGPLYIGGDGSTQFPSNANMPTRESTTNMMWQATECCARTY